jgi:hypothetical protein
MEADRQGFVCHECGAAVSEDDIARIVLEMESCDAASPHCGKVKHIDCFSKVLALKVPVWRQGAGLEPHS